MDQLRDSIVELGYLAATQLMDLGGDESDFLERAQLLRNMNTAAASWLDELDKMDGIKPAANL